MKLSPSWLEGIQQRRTAQLVGKLEDRKWDRSRGPKAGTHSTSYSSWRHHCFRCSVDWRIFLSFSNQNFSDLERLKCWSFQLSKLMSRSAPGYFSWNWKRMHCLKCKKNVYLSDVHKFVIFWQNRSNILASVCRNDAMRPIRITPTGFGRSKAYEVSNRFRLDRAWRTAGRTRAWTFCAQSKNIAEHCQSSSHHRSTTNTCAKWERQRTDIRVNHSQYLSLRP